MQLNPSEISELIKNRIRNLDAGAQMRTQGTVVSVTDGICRIHGLSDVMQGEMLEFPQNTFGLALNLERDSVGSVILGEYTHISEGDTVKTTGKILSVPIGPELLGRVVNSLGLPIDGKGPINAKLTDVIEKVAPGVIARQSVSQPVQTGLKAIDAMVPVGRGQRELIIGDRQTGKTAVAVDTIINQKGKDLFCVYVAIGQKASTIASVLRKLEEHGAMAYTIIVAASASESAAMQYIAPYAGCRPAINAGISVSRVGGAAQTKIMKRRDTGGGVRLALAQYRELAAFAQFASDLDEATRKQLERGRMVTELMKQPQYQPLQVWEMALTLFAVNNGYFDDVDVKKALAAERSMRDYIKSKYATLVGRMEEKKDLSADDEKALHDAIKDWKKNGSF